MHITKERMIEMIALEEHDSHLDSCSVCRQQYDEIARKFNAMAAPAAVPRARREQVKERVYETLTANRAMAYRRRLAYSMLTMVLVTGILLWRNNRIVSPVTTGLAPDPVGLPAEDAELLSMINENPDLDLIEEDIDMLMDLELLENDDFIRMLEETGNDDHSNPA